MGERREIEKPVVSSHGDDTTTGFSTTGLSPAAEDEVYTSCQARLQQPEGVEFNFAFDGFMVRRFETVVQMSLVLSPMLMLRHSAYSIVVGMDIVGHFDKFAEVWTHNSIPLFGLNQ